jgi:predicted nucleotidyltransferase
MPENTDALATVCRRYGVRRLQLFGSTARGEDRPDSDVDLLVEYEPGHVETLENMTVLEDELSVLFDGRPIDMAKPKDVHWYIREDVLASARVLYEKE